MRTEKAIETIETMRNYYPLEDDEKEALDMAISAMESLPKETDIYCKDCKHWLNGHLCNHWSKFGTVETGAFDYCSGGRRKE